MQNLKWEADLGVLVVVAPQRADLVLAADIPDLCTRIAFHVQASRFHGALNTKKAVHALAAENRKHTNFAQFSSAYSVPALRMLMKAHCEADVLVLDRLDIEANGRNRRHNLSELELVPARLDFGPRRLD